MLYNILKFISNGFLSISYMALSINILLFYLTNKNGDGIFNIGPGRQFPGSFSLPYSGLILRCLKAINKIKNLTKKSFLGTKIIFIKNALYK